MTGPPATMRQIFAVALGRAVPRRAMLAVVAGVLCGLLVVQEARAADLPAIDSAVQQIQKYCSTSWRNARVSSSEWSDCTQQVFAELLGVVSPQRLERIFRLPKSEERRHLERAIWRVAKRTTRVRRTPQVDRWVYQRSPTVEPDFGTIDDALEAAELSLSPRQLQIIRMVLDGHSVRAIAQSMGLRPAQVSDEKYRAMRRLRESNQPDLAPRMNGSRESMS
jgi:DNA-binding CsgD family transcriptional regulator